MAPLKTTNYGALFKKLKKELVESTPMPINKKPKKDEQIYYLTNSQLWFLDVLITKDIMCPLCSRFPWKWTNLWIVMLWRKPNSWNNTIKCPHLIFFFPTSANSIFLIMFSYRHSFWFDFCHSKMWSCSWTPCTYCMWMSKMNS